MLLYIILQKHELDLFKLVLKVCLFRRPQMYDISCAFKASYYIKCPFKCCLQKLRYA